MKSSPRARPRGLVLLVGFAIVLPGAILGILTLYGLEGDRLSREKLMEERHQRVAEGIATRLEESVDDIVTTVEAEIEEVGLERGMEVADLRAELGRLEERLPAVRLFFLVSGDTWELVFPEAPVRPARTGDLQVLRARFRMVLQMEDPAERASRLTNLFVAAGDPSGGHPAAILRQEIGLSLASLFEESGGELDDLEARFRGLEFRERYASEICDQIRGAGKGTPLGPERWRTAETRGAPVLYGTRPLPGGPSPQLLGFVIDLRTITDDLLPRIVAASGDRWMRIEVRDQAGTRLAGSTAGDFLPTTLSLGMGLPRWTIEVGGDREEFERRHATRRGILFGLITFLALAIFAGAAWTVRGVTREMEAARQQSDFVASVSHELRTPLTSIRMFSDLIRSGRAPTPEKQLEYARIISRESERLGALISNVLDFSRLEEGRRAFEKAPTAIGDLVRKAVDHFREHLLVGEHPIEVRIEEDLPTLHVDPDAISRAIQNLLGNAVKYSEGAAGITVRGIRRGREVRIEVEDRGEGIPEKERERIFEKFYRGSGARAAGCGLGLAIVRAILEGHDGEVRVASKVGEGSTFTLVLPVKGGGESGERTVGPPEGRSV